MMVTCILLAIVSAFLFASTVATYEKFRMCQEHSEAKLKITMEHHRDAVERLADAENRHSQIEAGLREQIQDLAQQLATLRVKHDAQPDFERFEPKPEPPEPYSEAITQFLLNIEYEGARALVEEDIERLRSRGHDDEQILAMISEGNYV